MCVFSLLVSLEAKATLSLKYKQQSCKAQRIALLQELSKVTRAC